MGGYRQTREAAGTVQMIPFSSERKAMGVVAKFGPYHWRLYIKGASEILTQRYIVVSRESTRDSMDKYGHSEIEMAAITELEEKNIQRTIIFYANQMLRTIALCYRDFTQWPPADLRPGVRDAVARCLKAGVTVKMCTGDNVLTVRSIATQCGIYTPGGIIME